MSDNVALLNPGNTDAHCSNEIMDLLRIEVNKAEDRLRSTRQNTYEDYIALFETAKALRRTMESADAIFGKRFRT